MSPFPGTWVANIEKSRRHANDQFQSATLTFEMTREMVSMIPDRGECSIWAPLPSGG